MSYTLITAAGKIKTYYVKAVAEMYQNIDGGVIVTNLVLNDEELATVVA